MKAMIINAVVDLLGTMKGEDLMQLHKAVLAEVNRRKEKPNGL